MASIDECVAAFERLAERLGASASAKQKVTVDRTISCHLKDLDVVYAGRLNGASLEDIRQVETSDADVRLSLSSDDLVLLADQELNFVRAWTAGRVTVRGSVFDLLKLRSWL